MFRQGVGLSIKFDVRHRIFPHTSGLLAPQYAHPCGHWHLYRFSEEFKCWGGWGVNMYLRNYVAYRNCSPNKIPRFRIPQWMEWKIFQHYIFVPNVKNNNEKLEVLDINITRFSLILAWPLWSLFVGSQWITTGVCLFQLFSDFGAHLDHSWDQWYISDLIHIHPPLYDNFMVDMVHPKVLFVIFFISHFPSRFATLWLPYRPSPLELLLAPFLGPIPSYYRLVC